MRINLDLRNSPGDQSQRMLNAIEPGSPLPIHRHRKSSETVVCLRGHTGFVIGLIGCDLGIGLPSVAGRQVPSDAECGGARDCGTHPSALNEG